MQNDRRFYVYTLTDPRNGEVFYVGKGCGRRDRSRLLNARRGDSQNPLKTRRIREVEASGHRVVVSRIAEGLSEAAAFRLERQTIAAYGMANLTNISRGQTTELERARLAADIGMEHMAYHVSAMLSGVRYSAEDVSRVFQIIRELREARSMIDAA